MGLAGLRSQQGAYDAVWPQGWAFFAKISEQDRVVVYRTSANGSLKSVTQRHMTDASLWGLDRSTDALSGETAYIYGRGFQLLTGVRVRIPTDWNAGLRRPSSITSSRTTSEVPLCADRRCSSSNARSLVGLVFESPPKSPRWTCDASETLDGPCSSSG